MAFFSWIKKQRNKAQSETGGRPDPPSLPTTPTFGLSTSTTADVASDNPFSKYGLPSPPQGHHSKTLEETEEQIRSEGFADRLSSTKRQTDKTKILVFLYGSGFFPNINNKSNAKKRKKMIKKIWKNKVAVSRLLRILSVDGDRDLTESLEAHYKREGKTLKAYFEQEGAFSFLPQGNASLMYFFRLQRQGNCFLQANAILTSYLLQHRGHEGCPPWDVSRFIRRNFTDNDLINYITLDDGGRTVDVLQNVVKSLTGKTAAVVQFVGHEIRKKSFDLEGKLQEYGPGLVSDFFTDKKFKKGCPENADEVGYVRFRGRRTSQGEFIHLHSEDDDADKPDKIEVTLAQYKKEHSAARSYPTPKKLYDDYNDDKSQDESDTTATTNKDGGKRNTDTHAMVLIGGRRDKHGNIFLLLQNSWKHMKLVEVAADYFENCGDAKITFVKHNDPEDRELYDGNVVDKLDKCYSLNRSLIADSNNLDRGCITGGDGCFSRTSLDR